MSRRMLMLLFVLAGLVAGMELLSAAPATAAELTASPAATVETAPCGETLDLALLAPAGGMCPAESPALSPAPAAPPFKLRTCRCSCGYPCQTDADCGPGGICSAGVTCC